MLLLLLLGAAAVVVCGGCAVVVVVVVSADELELEVVDGSVTVGTPLVDVRLPAKSCTISLMAAPKFPANATRPLWLLLLAIRSLSSMIFGCCCCLPSA